MDPEAIERPWFEPSSDDEISDNSGNDIIDAEEGNDDNGGEVIEDGGEVDDDQKDEVENESNNGEDNKEDKSKIEESSFISIKMIIICVVGGSSICLIIFLCKKDII